MLPGLLHSHLIVLLLGRRPLLNVVLVRRVGLQPQGGAGFASLPIAVERRSGGGCHSLNVMRLLAGAEVDWVIGVMESNERARSDNDLGGGGLLALCQWRRGVYPAPGRAAARC